MRSPAARSRRARLGLLAALALVVAACGAAAATPAPSPTPPAPTPTPVPGTTDGPGSGGGGGLVPGPGDGIFDGQATVVVPVPGQRDPHAINVQRLRPIVDGRRVQVELRWWSGVAPCYVLDSVRVDRSDEDRTISLTAVEGFGPPDVVCIEIAQLTATIVDLGELPAGSWTIDAAGDAAPITIEIS